MGYKGRHRLPSTGRKNAAAFVVVGSTALLGANQGMAAAVEPAGPPGGWSPIIACESGGDPDAKNPDSSAAGLFQFINSTWERYGGREFAPTARQATIREQFVVAERAYKNEGLRPWDASRGCWDDKVAEAEEEQEARDEAKQPVPDRVSSEPSPEPVLPPEAEPGPFTAGEYEVVPGDTLSEIAEAHDVPGGWKALYERNRDVVEHQDWIWPGERIDLN